MYGEVFLKAVWIYILSVTLQCEGVPLRCLDNGYLNASLIIHLHDVHNSQAPLLTDLFLSRNRTILYGIINLKLTANLEDRAYTIKNSEWNQGEKSKGSQWFVTWENGSTQRCKLIDPDPSGVTLIFYLETKRFYKQQSNNSMQMVTVTGKSSRSKVMFRAVPLCTAAVPRKSAELAACTATLGDLDVGLMQQWVVYHLLQGFSHFYIYLNDIRDQWVQHWSRALGSYIAAGLVTLIDWTQPAIYDKMFRFQMSVYHSCLYRQRGTVQWVGFFDTDEYWAPYGNKTVLSRLRSIKSQLTPGVSANSWYYGRSSRDPPQGRAPTLDRYTAHADDWVQKGRQKVIVRPELVQWLKVHQVAATVPGAGAGQVLSLSPRADMYLMHLQDDKTYSNDTVNADLAYVYGRLAEGLRRARNGSIAGFVK